MLVLIVGGVNAQDIQYTQNTKDKDKRSSLTVDPSTLGMNLQIPLASYAGRAGDSLPIGLQYSSKLWHMEYGGQTGLGAHVNGWVYPAFEQSGGWTTTLKPPVLKDTSPYFQFTVSGTGSTDCTTCSPPQTSHYVIYRIQVQMPDGSTHEMRKNDSAVLFDASHPLQPNGTYYSVDGAHMKLEYYAGQTNDPPSVLYLPDGSRFIFGFDTNGYSLITNLDRNGNKLVYGRDQSGAYQWTDSLGRIIGLQLPVSPTVGTTSYTLPGFNGSSLTYTLHWKNLADARTDPNQALRYLANYSNCDLGNTTTHSSSLFGTGTSCDGDEFNNQVFNPVLLSQIDLPNGESYKFSYNVFGEIDKVIYPTGGYERFQYDTTPAISYMRNSYAQGNRGVVDHWISIDGSGADENDHHWHYAVSYPNNTPPYKVTATAPDGTYTERYLYSSPNLPPFKLEDARTGRAYDERSFSSTGQMLRRTLTDWQNTGSMTGGWSDATRNPRVAKSVQLILDTGGDALVKTTTYGYDTTYQFDTGIEQTSVNEYDFATTDQTTAQSAAIGSMPTGTLLRTTESSYLDGDSNYRARNLIGLVSSSRVKDSSGNIVAQSSISYDESSYPLLTYSSVTGWTDPATNYRGNATTVSHWLNTTNAYLAAHTQYDQCGSVRNSWDAKGNESQIEYASTNAYAYPTLTRTAVPDANGTYGSTTALVSTSVFDFNTGLATSATDANNVTSNLEYNDSLIRPTRTVAAYGSGAQTQSPVIYDDANRKVTGQSDLNSFNDSALKTESFYDGIGRTSEARNYEGGTNYIAVQTQYDAMGRAYKVSNPFRPWQSETPVWTTSAFDALGRVISVTTPDGAVVTTSYAGNTVTVTDQAGKKRRSVTDALGRLVRVDEPDANGNLDVNGAPVQSTSYAYDRLDNLTTVTQGSQTRTFVYDSLKRLTSATNPESGTIQYQYDADGNLTQKTDARGVVATYAYDALNRNTTVTYTNDPANTPTVTRTYDGATNGLGKLWKTETAGGTRTTIDSYDAMGRPLTERQQFFSNNSWSASFTITATYDKAGHVLTETYPSNHTVSYNYDSAGRLADKDAQHLAFTGNLGDGTTRTYANEVQYTAMSGVQQEKFGTDTPLYHKQRFNVRGQLWDMRASTVSFASDPANGDRGAVVNYYSNGFTQGGSGTGNNGNVLRQESYVPGGSFFQDNFAYDSLNRLTSISEKLNGAGSDSFKQAYSFDRWGNRTIDYNNTSSTLPRPQFTVDQNTNRLTVPTGQGGTMHYDAAGNLDVDTYSGAAVSRLYDAENRMTRETQANSVVAGIYSYDGDGRRVKRNLGGTETWQVYGLAGELLAEYPANGPATSPSKEYGYRNGQLLVTAEPGSAATNVALASNGATASSSSVYTSDYPAASVINGDRRGLNWTSGGGWNDAAPGNTFPDWLEVDFNGNQTISEIDVFTVQDHYNWPVEPTDAMTFTLYGLTGFDVQYWNGSGWATIPGGSVTGNNKVWRKFSFSAITTSKIRVLTNASSDGYSRLTEVEAWTGPSPAPRYDQALAANGAVATSSSNYGSAYGPSCVTDGDRKSLYWGNGGGWNDAAPSNTFPDWVQIDFAGSKTINEIDVYTLQDNWGASVEPTEAMTFSQWGLTGYDVQYWDGSGWVTVPGGSVSGNNKVWRKFTFTPITTTKIRVLTNASVDGYSRLTEIEAYSPATSAPSSNIHWLVTDQLGTPRMIFDQSGSLTNVSRHDYLPFGEELFAGTGGRTTALGYTNNDGARQKFSEKERDNETGLDYFLARCYSSTQGRFTSPDEFLNDTHVADPASWNLYVYVRNSPLRLGDPTGETINGDGLTDAERQQLIDDWKKKTGYNNIYFDKNNNLVIDKSAGIAQDENGKLLGSEAARENLTDAVEISTRSFDFVPANGNNDVAFADSQRTGFATVTNGSNSQTIDHIQVRIDFSDFNNTNRASDPDAIEAHSIGIVAFHEIDHWLYGDITDDPNGRNDPGPVERKYINPILQQLGLAQRVTYGAVPVGGSLREAYSGYVQVRYTLNGADRMLRWQDAVVGGPRK